MTHAHVASRLNHQHLDAFPPLLGDREIRGRLADQVVYIVLERYFDSMVDLDEILRRCFFLLELSELPVFIHVRQKYLCCSRFLEQRRRELDEIPRNLCEVFGLLGNRFGC